MEHDVRWRQRFANYKKALSRLLSLDRSDEAWSAYSELEKEGIIQRFEYTTELAWKTLQDLISHRGYLDIKGPKPVIQQAFEMGLIVDGPGWVKLLNARNRTSHSYEEVIAEEILADILSKYVDLLSNLEKTLSAEEEKEVGKQTRLFDE